MLLNIVILALVASVVTAGFFAYKEHEASIHPDQYPLLAAAGYGGKKNIAIIVSAILLIILVLMLNEGPKGTTKSKNFLGISY